jgi:hypothetical protein
MPKVFHISTLKGEILFRQIFLLIFIKLNFYLSKWIGQEYN